MVRPVSDLPCVARMVSAQGASSSGAMRGYFGSSPVDLGVVLPGGTWGNGGHAGGWLGSISPPLSSTYVAGSLLSLFAGWMVWALLLTKESLKHQLILQQSAHANR